MISKTQLRFCLLLTSCLSLLAACNYTIKIKDGKTAFAQKQYATAIPMLKKEFDRAKTKVEKGKTAWLLGQSFDKTGQAGEANNWYKMAAENQFGPDALRAAAFGLKKQEKYAEAAAAFKELGIEIGSPYEFRKEITACNVAADWLARAPKTGISVEPAAFNSTSNDFGAAFFSDGRLVFSSDRAAANGDDNYHWTGQKFMDIFIVEKEAVSAQSFDNQLNTPANEGSASFTGDFQEMVFVRAVASEKGADAFNKIFVSRRDGDGWSQPVAPDFQKEKINYLGPAISADGQTLFFVANDPDGQGGFDLFQSKRKASGEFDTPQMLPRNLNTTANELFPTLDGDTLYFSSDGLPGMGGLDIFKTWRMDKNAAWSPPQNLQSPINSGADELGFIIEKRGAKLEKGVLAAGFFTSNRPGGRGGDDIFQFKKRQPPLEPLKPVDTTKTTIKPSVFKLLLEGYVVEKIFSNPDDPNSKMLGRRPLGGSQVDILFGKNRKQVTVGDDGFFRLELEENTDYSFAATKDGWLANSAKFSTKNLPRDPLNPTQIFELEIQLDRIFRDREIVLENIYYDYDRAEIRPDAEPTLNRLAEMLRQNPSVKIELGSHTDCRGNGGYNLDLSQRRAESAVNFLISTGLNAGRLVARGWGEGNPAVDCNCPKCTEEEHQANRRTTFKVIE